MRLFGWGKCIVKGKVYHKIRKKQLDGIVKHQIAVALKHSFILVHFF